MFPTWAAHPGRATFTVTDDTHVLSSNLNSNYGGEPLLHVSRMDYAGTTYVEETWLKFNLSAIPSGALVEAATLELHTSSVSESYTINAHSCLDIAWTEYSLTYGKMPAFNETSIASVVVTGSNKWYSWNVVDSVQGALNAKVGQVSIVLEEQTLHGFLRMVKFDSKEGANSGGYSARLTVQWTSALPEFVPELVPCMAVLATSLMLFCRGMCQQKLKHGTGASAATNSEKEQRASYFLQDHVPLLLRLFL